MFPSTLNLKRPFRYRQVGKLEQMSGVRDWFVSVVVVRVVMILLRFLLSLSFAASLYSFVVDLQLLISFFLLFVDTGRIFYVDHNNETTSWEHPLADQMKKQTLIIDNPDKAAKKIQVNF